MARIKGGLNAKKKHNKTLKLAKGYRGARSKQYRIAKQSVSGSHVSMLLQGSTAFHTADLCSALSRQALI